MTAQPFPAGFVSESKQAAPEPKAKTIGQQLELASSELEAARAAVLQLAARLSPVLPTDFTPAALPDEPETLDHGRSPINVSVGILAHEVTQLVAMVRSITAAADL